MENYDLFGDDLGSGMLEGLGDLGGANFNNSTNQPTGAGNNMMQSYNNQQPQYTQIGQGMSLPTKMTPGNYPDYSNQYGQYSAGASQQPPPGLGGYGVGAAPTRPMAGYPYPHQPSASPSMHYQDYSVVQNSAGMIRPPAPTPQHAPPPRMITPSSQQAQQHFAGYRPPSQESMYLQQFPRWNEQQTPYGASSLPHHYPSSASGYRAPAPPPHAYPSNLPRPPQPINQSAPPQPPQQQSSQQQPPPSSAVNSQQQQHNIPYMPRPQTPSVMPSQPQYGQSMYPNSSNQYPNYHHASPSVGQLPSAPTPSSSSYPHHSQQQYNLATPSPQHQYSNQYGQYYPTGTNASLSNPPQGPPPPPSNPMAYPGSYPPPPSVVPNGTPSYRPGYAQLPQLSPRQPTPSPRQQPVPSPKPPSSTTPTIPASPAPPSMSQSQQSNSQQQQPPQPPPPQQQQQLPSSLQQLEQMVMPHVNNKNSPSPKPQQHANLQSGGGGVLSPMSMGGPKTPMSPGMQGPKTPMSPPTQWQTQGPRPPVPQIASKPAYLHTQQQQQQQQQPNSPSSYGHGQMPNSSTNVESTINSVASRPAQDTSDIELSGLNATLDTSVPDISLPLKEELKPPSTPIPISMPSHQQPSSMQNEVNGMSSISEVSKPQHSESSSSKENQSQISEEQRFSHTTTTNSTSNKESPMEGEKSGALLTSLSSSKEISHSIAQYTSNSSRESNPMSNPNSQIISSPSIPLSSTSQSQSQQPDFGSQYSASSINGTTDSPHQPIGIQPNSQSQVVPPAPGQMMGNNMMGGYGPGPGPLQPSQPFGNMGSPQSSMKPMMPSQNSHQYPPQRFPGDPNVQQQPYMNNYHNTGMYPVAPYGQQIPGPMRPTGPLQYPMGPQVMPGGPPDRFAYEAHQLNQQLQHLFSLPPNPQSQVQINELQERLRNLEQQAQSMPGSQFPMQGPMGGIIPGAPPYVQMGMAPMGVMPMDIPIDLPENGPSKGKKKKERKPRGEPKSKGKKGKGKVDTLVQPPQLSDEIYEFQDFPLEIPEKKSNKKQRKPREKSPPKPKRGKEPKEKTPKSSRSRKKIKPSDDGEESMNSSYLGGEPIDAEIMLPKIEDNSESDQKNGIGAAGIIAEGGPSASISGEDGDISAQDLAVSNDAEAVTSSELATPEKAKSRPKKPKLKSNSTGKKRPSKTLLAFKNRKKRRRSDSEVSEPERTPPPSPLPEEDLNKRRSGRNTQRKKYIDDIDLALSDEDLLPNKALKKAIEASVATASEAKPSDETLPPIEGQTETDVLLTPVLVATPTKTPTTREKSKTVTEESPNLNKHNFFYVNTSEEDTMIVQHILTMRLGKREVIDSSDDEDEEEKKQVKPTETEIETEGTEKKADDNAENAPNADITENVIKPEENVQKTDSCDPPVTPIVSEASEPLLPTTIVPEIVSTEPEKSDMEVDSIKIPDPETVEPVEKMDVVQGDEVENDKKESPEEENTNPKIDDTTQPETESKSTDEEKADTSDPLLEKTKKEKESRTIEVEEFYVKYKNFSYLHCEWKTEEELMKGDKRVNGKIKRFKQKLINNANIFEFIEEDPFNPDYVEVDRVLDMSEVTDPSGKITKNYLVKWRSLPYDEATWELEDDIDPEKLAQYRRFHLCPERNQWKRKPRPKASEWVKMGETEYYNNGNTLREYQLEGLNWLSFSWFNGRNCILADEMGLGKTIQSLTFVESVHRYGIRGPFLVIAPLSTVPNWQREFETWTDLNVVVYHGSVASRNMIQEYELFYRHPDNPQMNLKDCYKFNVLITTFEIVLTDVMELKDFPWRVCVIDEAHRLKNKNCKLLEGLRMLNMEHRVLLSGTPLQNNVQELFSLLNFLEPSQFASDESFVKEFGDLKSESQVQKLQALLKPMMLRRLKEDVEKSIAPKEETIVEVELTNMQKKYYRAILERNFSFLSKGTTSSNIPNLMNTMMELRKCCIHPYLLNGAEEQIQLDYRLTHNLPECDPDVYYKALVQSSGKMVLVDKLLAKLKDGGHRVLVFSQMVRCLDILEDYLIYRQYPYERLDGRIRGSLRQAAIDRYSKPDSDRFVFLLCTKAGGLGINLTAADTVIIYDSDWNPQNDLQAQARCHRIGQSKKVKIYRLICRNTYEREMFDRASLKLGLDRAVLQSMNTTQGGRIDPNAQASKQLTKKEVEDLLKRGAYGALMDEDDGEKFCEEDIDVILERRTQIITLESGEKGSTFSKASFAATGNREDISVDDPDFWKKWAKRAEIDPEELNDKNTLVLDEPRRRTQIRRYGHDEGVMVDTDVDSSTDSEEDNGNVGDRTRSGKASSRRSRSGKGKRGRRGNLDDEYVIDDGIVEYGKWSKSECYKIERGLLTFGWKRWNKILEQGQFRLGWDEHHMENCARLILLHCVTNFRGDEKVKSFVADLICPLENANSITRNHSGLANPVSRGGRKSKKKELLMMMKMEEEQTSEDWMKDMRYDTETHLDPAFIKHLSKNANKVLLRIRMLYYIKQEIIGHISDRIDREVPPTQLNICPPSLVVDVGPVDWWDKVADSSLLAGTYKHGYERYNIMRQDPALCFLNRVGPPDGSAVLAEISSEVNEEEMEKDEDEESNLEAKEPSISEKKETTDTEKEGGAEPMSTDENPKPESTEPEKPIWPSTTDMNTRIRKLITAFQRYFKKEELKNAQKAKRMERKDKIDQIVRDRERQKMEVHQKRWSKKEEADFYRTISTFGVQRIERKKFDWSKFRAISRLDKKFDDTLTEYFRAFYAMCKRICGQKLSEEEDLIQVPVDPLPEDRARRTLDRIDLLDKIRTEIIHYDNLDERLKLCLPSLDMPEWWIPGKHDRDLLYGAARHGLGRTELFYVNDPELSFREILRRHMAGEPLLDQAEKDAYKNPEKKIKSESEKRIRPDMVDIEIEDLKGNVERRREADDAKKAAKEKEMLLAEEAEKSEEISTSKEKGEEEEIVKLSEASIEDKSEKDDKEAPRIKTEKPDFEETTDVEPKDINETIDKLDQVVKQEPMDISESADAEKVSEPKEPESMEVDKDKEKQSDIETDKKQVGTKEKILEDKPASPEALSLVKEKETMKIEHVNEEKESESKQMDVSIEEKEKVTNEKDESQGSSMEMNEVHVSIKNELKITIKLPAEKMRGVEVQVKGSPKFSMPELPAPTIEKEELPKSTLPKFDPFMSSDSNNMEALLNSTNPIRWPRDRAIQIRLEHIIHAVEKNEWPVSRFFSSAAMTETFEYSPQGTPENATPARDTPTPISECSDLAPAEDLIMSLPSSNSTSSMVSSTTITPVSLPGRRGRRRKIAIDVETERAKLQALLTQTMHQSNLLSHLPNNARLSSALRRERGDRSSRGLNLSHESDKELESRLTQMNIPSLGKSSKFQPPPPAHQHHTMAGAAASLLRNSHQQQQQQQQQQQHRRSRSPITRRGSPGFSTQAQSSTLDLSIKSSHKDVAAAAMSALSSLSSVTVTPVTLSSSSSKRDRNRDGGGVGSGGLTISSSPMDLSGGLSKKPRESPSSMLEKAFSHQDAPLNFGGPPKKASKLENMLDKLKKKKMGDSPDLEPQPVEKDKKRRKLDEIVFGLSATKGSNIFSPPLVPEKRSGAGNISHQSQGGRNASSPQVSSHSGARSGTPSPAMPVSMGSKEAQAFAQNFLNNPLLSALSMFNAKDLKDLKDFSRFAANAANLQATNTTKKDTQRLSANSPTPGASQTPEMPKCDLSRLAEIAVPKFDLFTQDAKVNKWLAEHSNITPERPPSPEYNDKRRRNRQTTKGDPLMLDWNKLSGEENVPVIHRANGKKISGPKAPQLKNLAQWLLENQNYDVDPRWAELVKERGNLPTDLQKRLQGEKKKGPGRPPTVTSPSPPTPTSSSANTPSVPTSSASNAFSNLGAFSNLPDLFSAGLSGINPNLLASFGALDPKNPLFMPFGGLGSLGNLSSLGNLANLGSLSGMGNLGLPNNLFGLGSPFMNFGQDMSGMPSSGGGGGGGEKGNSSKDGQQSSGNSGRNSSQSKRDEKSKKASNASQAAAQAQAQQNLLSSSLPFLFPNPGLMYNPLGLGSFPLGGGVSGSPFGNLGQGSMLNGMDVTSSSSGNKKSSGGGGSKSSASNANPLLAAGLAGLNIPSLSKKDMKELAAMTGHANLLKQHERSSKGGASKDNPAAALAAMMSASQPPAPGEDSDDESLKSLMGNHQDELPDDDVAPENAERIVLRESKELEKEMNQQKMETRREKRIRDREDRGGLTSAERQLLMEKKKERLAKEDDPPRETTTSSTGRTTRRSAANRSRNEDTTVTKLKDASDDDSPEKC